jgi:hypothetical protein
MGCVDGDAVVHVNRCGKGRKMTLATLFDRWQRWDKTTPAKVRSWCGGELRQHDIQDVLSGGEKAVVKIALRSGKNICVTANHEIAGPGGKWITASELKRVDAVLTNGKAICRRCGSDRGVATYRYARFRGYCLCCIYRYLRADKWHRDGKHLDKDGYVRVSGQWEHPRNHNGTVLEHILVVESALGRWLSTREYVHHLNGKRSDNRLENLQIVTASSLHCLTRRHLNLDGCVNRQAVVKFIPILDIVESVEPFGIRAVYDVVMKDPYRSFVADGVVVH